MHSLRLDAPLSAARAYMLRGNFSVAGRMHFVTTHDGARLSGESGLVRAGCTHGTSRWSAPLTALTVDLGLPEKPLCMTAGFYTENVSTTCPFGPRSEFVTGWDTHIHQWSHGRIRR